MSYTKQTWANGDIITAAKLNHMEDGIAGVEADVSSLNTQLLASMPHDTASGSIASFPDGAAMPVIDCSVAVAPNQNLHGYDNPWPAGGGKNLFDAAVFPTTSNNGVTCTNNVDGSFTVNGTATADTFFGIFDNMFANDNLPSATYRLTGGVAGGGDSTYQLYVRPGYYADNNATGTTFTGSVIGGSIFVKSGYTCNNLVFRPMLRLASNGDDTFAPYSNICPISGWAECKVTRTGKNMNPNSGVNYTATNSTPVFLPAGNYVFSTDNGQQLGNSNALYIRLKDKDGNDITNGGITSTAFAINGAKTFYYGGTERTAAPFTLNYDAYVQFGFNNQMPTNIGALQLELGSSATTYEEYRGTTYTIDLDGTRYGGTLDVTTGKLTVDASNKVDLSTFSGYGTNLYGFDDVYRDVSGLGYASVLSCEMFPVRSTVEQVRDLGGVTIAIGSGGVQRLVFRIIGKTAAETRDIILAQANNIVFALDTPIEVDLDPVTIETLLGTNNIWADAGDTTVSYYADPTLYINKKIAAAVAALS